MENTYKFRKYIARLSFLPYFVMLLLALNFKIWGGVYSENDVANLIINQSDDLEHCIITNIINSQQIIDTVKVKQLADIGLCGNSSCSILFTLAIFILIYRRNLFNVRQVTLISLCVRMDD